MALIKPNILQLTDLIVHEYDPAIGATRRTLKVTVDAAKTLPLGTVVFRAKALTDTPYAPLTAAAGLSLDNEYAILIGDRLDIVDPIPFIAPAQDTGAFNAVALVGGMQVTVKRAKIKAANPTLTDANIDSLKVLMEREQNIIIEQSI